MQETHKQHPVLFKNQTNPIIPDLQPEIIVSSLQFFDLGNLLQVPGFFNLFNDPQDLLFYFPFFDFTKIFRKAALELNFQVPPSKM